MTMKHFYLDQPTLSKYHMHPLGKYLNSYSAHMYSQGFALSTGRWKIRAIFKFSRWLKRHGVNANELTLEIIDRYVHRKGRKYCPSLEEAFTLKQFAEFLQTAGVIANGLKQTIPKTPIEETANSFAVYLQRERGLCAATVRQYKRHTVLFLNDIFPDGEPKLSAVRVTDVVGYVQRKAALMSRKVAKMMTTSLRSFLRYARFQGYVEMDLAASVPAVANWAMGSIPRFLPRHLVEKVLSECDRETATGQRDYAILLLIARLGLRAGEVVSLRLEDIDWRARCITVHGKGSNLSKMPLPADVGEALAVYLRRSRPKSRSRSIFLGTTAPKVGFSKAGAVSLIVARALKRAGVETERYGAHQFRHGLATHLLQVGGSLPEIAELLRHQTLQCTNMYAKVDLISLRSLGLAWPGGDQ